MSRIRVLRAATLLILSAGLMAGCSGAEERLARYQQRGEQFFAEGNLDKARVEFSNVLQIDPENAQARFMSGQIAERQSNPRDAVGHYQAAIDADSSHVAARAALGRLFVFGGLPDRALELAETGLAGAPENPQLLVVRGAARARLGDRASGLLDAENAIRLDPANEYAIALVASLYRQNGQNDQAVEAVRNGVRLLPANVDLKVMLADLEYQQRNLAAAEGLLRNTVELQPDSVPNWQRLARYYVLTDDAAAAERAMRDGLKAMPDDLAAKLALVEFIGAQRGAADAEQQLLAFAAEDRGSHDLKLALGQFYEGRGNADRAQETYREIVADAGTSPAGLTARNRIAAMLAQKNDVTGAQALIAEVLQENPGDNDALILRATLAMAGGDADAAITDLRTVLRDQPRAVPVMRALARAYLEEGDVALAEETLRSASEASPQDTATRLELASILIRTGRFAQARPMLDQLVVEVPDSVQAMEALFRVQIAQQDIEGARDTAAGVERIRPDLALGFHLSGVAAEAEQRTEDAVTSYEKALEIQPDSAEPLASLVRIEVRQNRRARALARVNAVIEQSPGNVVSRNLKGELLTADGDYEGAQQEFSEAIAVAPRWWVPYRGLAVARLAVKDAEGAVAALKEGVQKTEGAPALATDLAALYERMGRVDDAIAAYEDLVARAPESTPAVNNLAMLLVSYKTDAASLDRARQLAEQLVPATDAAFVNTRGWVLYKRGEFQEALPLLQRAVDQSPDSPVMRYHLGMAQLKLGDNEGARQNLEQAVKAERAFAGIEEARTALETARRPG